MLNKIFKQMVVNVEQITKLESDFLKLLKEVDENFVSFSILYGRVEIWKLYGEEFFEENLLKIKIGEFKAILEMENPVYEILRLFKEIEDDK